MLTSPGSPAAAVDDHRGARVVADVGGTNVRFATVGATTRAIERVDVMACAEYARIEDAFHAYTRRHGIEDVTGVCIAVAGPAGRDVIELPNSHWRFSRLALERAIGAPLEVINDFSAQALCIDLLLENELRWFGEPRPEAGGYRAVIGPGTGLGVAVQTPGGEVVPSEAGHFGFAPANEHEIALLRALLHRYHRVSIERVLSGPGLENLYWANAQLAEAEVAPPLRAPEIAQLAEAGDGLARRTITDFFGILATFAGDMALTAWATGGVYLSGGVLKKLVRFFDVACFRARFEDKGRFSGFCAGIPIAHITAEHPGLLGCSAALALAQGSA